AERRASHAMLKAKRKAVGHRVTAGADKAYDTKDHIGNLRAIGVTVSGEEARSMAARHGMGVMTSRRSAAR
ncbi:MAG: hypothetical protein CR217_16075, partial [Beijerinckiaceae bacterium]